MPNKVNPKCWECCVYVREGSFYFLGQIECFSIFFVRVFSIGQAMRLQIFYCCSQIVKSRPSTAGAGVGKVRE